MLEIFVFSQPALFWSSGVPLFDLFDKTYVWRLLFLKQTHELTRANAHTNLRICGLVDSCIMASSSSSSSSRRGVSVRDTKRAP